MVVSQVEERNEGMLEAAPKVAQQGRLRRMRSALGNAAAVARAPNKQPPVGAEGTPASQPKLQPNHRTLRQHIASHQVRNAGSHAAATSDPQDYGVHPAQMSMPGPGSPKPLHPPKESLVAKAISAVKGRLGGEPYTSRPEVGHIADRQASGTKRRLARGKSASFADADSAFATSSTDVGGAGVRPYVSMGSSIGSSRQPPPAAIPATLPDPDIESLRQQQAALQQTLPGESAAAQPTDAADDGQQSEHSADSSRRQEAVTDDVAVAEAAAALGENDGDGSAEIEAAPASDDSPNARNIRQRST